MQIRQTIISCWLLVSTTALGLARDIFVDNIAGSDSKNGRRVEAISSDGPVRTLDRALRLARRGDRIVLAKTTEPYREVISLSDVEQRGYPDRPLVIQGNGAVLDGTVVAAPGAWKYESDNLFSFRPRRLTYQQLFLDGKPLQRVPWVRYAGGTVPIEPLEWALVADRIVVRVEEGRLPDQYALRHAGLQTGITLYNTEYVRIENLIVQGFQQDGINAHELVRHCELVNVECRANGRSGISVGGVSRVTILNSRCYDNGRTQLRIEALGQVTASGCDFDQVKKDVPWLEIRGGRAVVDGVPYVMQAR